MAGLRALDRCTVQLKLHQPDYPNIEYILTTRVIAREVVAAAGADIRARPVGTGPYRLKEWKRGSRIVLEANPDYRTVRFPESSDPALAPMIREMRGKALPQVGVVEINVIEEDVTRLLEFDPRSSRRTGSTSTSTSRASGRPAESSERAMANGPGCRCENVMGTIHAGTPSARVRQSSQPGDGDRRSDELKHRRTKTG